MVQAIHHKIEAAEEETLTAWKISIDRIESLEKRVTSLKTLLEDRNHGKSIVEWIEKYEQQQRELFSLQATLESESVKYADAHQKKTLRN